MRSFEGLQKVLEPRLYTVMNLWDFGGSSGLERVSSGSVVENLEEWIFGIQTNVNTVFHQNVST